MTITNGYTTVINIRARKSITSVDGADDAVIESLVEQASRLIDNETGRRFYVNTVDETRVFSSRNGDCIFVDDLVSVTTLKSDLDGDRTYEVTMATTDFDLMPENAALDGKPYTWIEPSPSGNYDFPTHRKSIQLVGKFGFPAVPADVRGACEEIVIGAYGRRTGENTSGVATITGAGVVLTPKDIPDTAARVIANYRRMF